MTGRARWRAAGRRAGRGLPALGSRPFRLLAGGQFVSSLGDGLYAVALPWYVLSHHGGAVLLGTVLAAYGIPRTCLIMVGGHLADRFGPWRVMMAADAARIILVGALAVVAARQRPDLVILVPIALGLGAGEGLFLPASFAIMPDLLDGPDLQGGNAVLSASTQVAAFAGPAAGGLAVAALGSAAAFGLDALSFAVSSLTLWRLGAMAAARAARRRIPARPGPAAGAEPDRRGGPGRSGPWAFIRHQRVMPLLLAINVAANLGSAGTFEVALPLFACGQLETGAAGYGLLVAGFGIGAVAGALAATRLRPGRRPAVPAGLVFLAQAPLMAGLAWAPGLATAVAIMVLWGVLNLWAKITTQTAFQRWAPPGLLGRLSGLMLTTSYGMFPVSVALAGFVVHRAGPGAFFILSAVAVAATLTWALAQQAFRDFGARPARGPSCSPVLVLSPPPGCGRDGKSNDARAAAR